MSGATKSAKWWEGFRMQQPEGCKTSCDLQAVAWTLWLGNSEPLAGVGNTEKQMGGALARVMVGLGSR